MKPSTPTCLVCGQPCAPADRNTDGSYAHADCLRGVQTYARPKEETSR